MAQIRHTVIIGISVVLLWSTLSSAENHTSTTAIFGAVEHELKMLEAQLTDKAERNIIGIKFVTGKMNGSHRTHGGRQGERRYGRNAPHRTL